MAEPSVDRRTLLRGAAGAAAVGAAATPAAAQSTSVEEWLSNAPNYDGIVDRQGSDTATIEVGVDTSAGPIGFGPAAIHVDEGTELRFEWVSDTHNIAVESQPEGADWGGVSEIRDEGYTTTHTFETAGVYRYYCEPHQQAGMLGAVVVGDVEVGHGGAGIVWTDELLALGGFVALGVLSPIVFGLFLKRYYRETAAE